MTQTFCYWRGSAEVRDDLVSALKENNIEVRLVRGLEELLDIIRRNKISAIVVDGTAGTREASDRFLEISNTERLREFPILFVSTQATARVSQLKSRIDRLLPLDVPYRAQNVLHGIKLLLDPTSEVDDDTLIQILNAPEASGGIEILQSEDAIPVRPAGKFEPGIAEQAPQSAAQAEQPSEVASSAPAEAPAEPKAASSAPASPVDPLSTPEALDSGVRPAPSKIRKTVEDTRAKTRERLKANPDPLNLNNTYGGEVFSIATESSDFDDKNLFPDAGKKEILAKAFAAFEKMDPWAAVHARRVTFVATAMANSLSLNRMQQQNVRLTCLFINWSNPDDAAKNVRRIDLFREPTPAARQEVAKSFRASAAMIRERLREERTADTVDLIAQMLDGEGAMSVQQKALIVEAECVLIVELADRSCWNNGHWNPFGVYRVIRHLRDKRPIISDDGVKVAMNRVLGEAVTSHVTVGNLYISSGDLDDFSSNVNFKRSAKSTLPSSSGGRRVRALSVSIADLLPGMTLAEPIVAVDGKTILESNTRLDQRLVLQVWQLAAVRALKSKTAIQVEL